jgi:hypothetical protein
MTNEILSKLNIFFREFRCFYSRMNSIFKCLKYSIEDPPFYPRILDNFLLVIDEFFVSKIDSKYLELNTLVGYNLLDV